MTQQKIYLIISGVTSREIIPKNSAEFSQ